MNTKWIAILNCCWITRIRIACILFQFFLFDSFEYCCIQYCKIARFIIIFNYFIICQNNHFSNCFRYLLLQFIGIPKLFIGQKLIRIEPKRNFCPFQVFEIITLEIITGPLYIGMNMKTNEIRIIHSSRIHRNPKQKYCLKYYEGFWDFWDFSIDPHG